MEIEATGPSVPRHGGVCALDLRRRADAGDAEAWNRLGEILLHEAPCQLSPSDLERMLAEPLHRLRSNRAGVNYYANDAFDYGDIDSCMEWEARLAVLDTAIRVHEIGVEQVARERSELRQQLLKKAFDHFEHSAHLGDCEGMWNCGWRYFLGEGVARNERNALLCWAAAAAKGHRQAAAKLANLASDDALRFHLRW